MTGPLGGTVRPRLNPLFSLSQALGRGRAAESYSSSDSTEWDEDEDEDEDEESSGSGTDTQEGEGSGSSEDSRDSSEMEESTEEQMSKVDCALCHRPLVPKGGRQRGQSADAAELRVCDGCHRCFHKECCKRRGISTRWDKASSSSGDREWHHSEACREARQILQARCAAGEVPLPGRGGRSLQLVDCQAGARRGSPEYKALEHVIGVLADHYGPFVFEQVEASDYGVLLRSSAAAEAAATALARRMSADSSPVHMGPAEAELVGEGPQLAGAVAAATLDVYGQECAKLDLLATREDMRLQGHARALVLGVEGLLADTGLQSLVVVLSTEDREGLSVWLNHFEGYKRLNNRQAGALASEYPHFKFYERRKTVFLQRQLPGAEERRKKQQAAQKQRQQKQRHALKGQVVEADMVQDGVAAKEGGKGGVWRMVKRILTVGLY